MLEFLKQPWHWSVAGIGIGLIVPILLLIGNKKFGISSSFRHICAICVPAKIPFFQYDWKKEIWNLFFVIGLFLGGVIAHYFLIDNTKPIEITQKTQQRLQEWNITDTNHLLPQEIFSTENIFSLKGFVFFVIGGFLVGFGTRYAGGCTSGHAIMGLSNLQLPSLIATISFMVGGFLSAQFILPFIFKFLR